MTRIASGMRTARRFSVFSMTHVLRGSNECRAVEAHIILNADSITHQTSAVHAWRFDNPTRMQRDKVAWSRTKDLSLKSKSYQDTSQMLTWCCARTPRRCLHSAEASCARRRCGRRGGTTSRCAPRHPCAACREGLYVVTVLWLLALWSRKVGFPQLLGGRMQTKPASHGLTTVINSGRAIYMHRCIRA